MTHAINVLSAAIKYVPTSLCNSQLAAIEDFCAIFANWITVEYSPTVPSAAVPNPLKTIVSLPKPSPIHYPAPTYKGDHFQGCLQTIDTSNSQGAESGSKLQGFLVTNSLSYKITSCSSPSIPLFEAQHQPLDEPITERTRSCIVLQNFTTTSRSWDLSAQILTHAAYSVLYNDTGKLLNYGQLIKHPKYKET